MKRTWLWFPVLPLELTNTSASPTQPLMEHINEGLRRMAAFFSKI